MPKIKKKESVPNRKINRLKLIIEKVDTGQYPSLQTILDALIDRGLTDSKRTIERDFNNLRNEFGVEIIYDNDKRGYYIDKENSPDFDTFLQFLGLVNTTEVLKESFLENKKTLNYIAFDTNNSLKGIEHLELLLKAIKTHTVITFEHYNRDKGTTTTRTLNPHLLKEYANRWYIVGEQDNIKEYRNYGVDRITNVQLTENTFTPNIAIDNSLYKDVIGLVYSDNAKQEVLLSFTPRQGEYIKTMQLHPSQKIVLENEKELQVSLQIKPNRELLERLVMYGNQVKVLQPKSLVDDIKTKLLETLAQY